MDSHKDVIPSYSFKVNLDGINYSFSKINNISGSVDIDTIIDGGTNNAPVLIPLPKRNPDMLILEKGTYTSASDVLFSSYFKEGTKIATLTISVMRDDKIVRMFFISGGVIIRREYSPLDATSSAVMVELLQIAHTGITELPLPFGI